MFLNIFLKLLTSKNKICQQEQNNILISAAVYSAVHWHKRTPSALTTLYYSSSIKYN